jgi:hypothetical protein
MVETVVNLNQVLEYADFARLAHDAIVEEACGMLAVAAFLRALGTPPDGFFAPDHKPDHSIENQQDDQDHQDPHGPEHRGGAPRVRGKGSRNHIARIP